MSTRPIGRCSNPDCNFNNGGACVEGFPEDEIVAKCPNFAEGDDDLAEVESPETDIEETAATEESIIEVKGIPLPSGEALSPEDLYKITRNCDAKIVLFGGPINSGKTTLILSIYEKFRRGPFANHFFAGSETLLGFEARCHLSRAASGLSEARTERTNRTHNNILHIVLAPEQDLASKVNILMVDASGELYEDARNSVSEIENIPLIHQADFFVYVFDGNKLANNRERQGIKNKGLEIIRTLSENGALGEKSNVQIVFSKKDQFSDGEDEVKNFIRDIETALKNAYSNKFQSLNFYTIAARPQKNQNIDDAYGVEDIITAWTEKTVKKEVEIDYGALLDAGLSPFDGFCRTMETPRE